MNLCLQAHPDMSTYPLKTSSACSSCLASSALQHMSSSVLDIARRKALTLLQYADRMRRHALPLFDMAPVSIRHRLASAECPSLSIWHGQGP